jgi:arylsulfatase A-like enzyme
VVRAGLLAALFLVLASVLGACGGAATPPERIILIVIDTLRRDYVSAYGSAASTPNLDALAARGQRFDRALASYHQTSMSMAALFTGRTPSLDRGVLNPSLHWNGTTWCGLARFGERPLPPNAPCLPDALPTLGEELDSAGYWTIGIVSNHFLFEPSGFSRGFDDWMEVGDVGARGGQRARMGVPQARKKRSWFHVNRAAEVALDRRDSDRFFLYVHYMDVHDYSLDSLDPPAALEAYARAVETVDVAVGKLIEALDTRGLLDGAVVVVTADHGERLDERHLIAGPGGHVGNPSHQEVLEVPLIVAPAIFDDPQALVRTQDLFDRLRSLAGLPDREGTVLSSDELLIGEKRFRTYLDGRFKSVIRRSDASHLLFDLEADPEEMRNVAGDHPDVATLHAERIDILSRQLGTSLRVRQELSEDERERLRALGYLE